MVIELIIEIACLCYETSFLTPFAIVLLDNYSDTDIKCPPVYICYGLILWHPVRIHGDKEN